MNVGKVSSVLVAVDLSGAAGDIIRGGAALAEAFRADFHLYHVIEDEYGVGLDARLGDAERDLRNLARRTGLAHANVASISVGYGEASERIVEHAAAIRADLIVMGPTRGAPRPDACLGSTAEATLRRAKMPILVVRDVLRLPLHRVVVPMDFSAASRRALERRSTGRWPSAARCLSVPSGRS